LNAVKKAIILVAVVMMTLGLWQFRKPYDKPIQEGDNIFSSEIYTHYHRQLNNFIVNHPLYTSVKDSPRTAFNSEIKKLIEEIEKPSGTPQEQRQFHEAFVHRLRVLANMSLINKIDSNEKNSLKLFEDIIHWLYLGADLQVAMQSFLFSHVSPPSKNLLEYFIETQQNLYVNSKFCGVEELVGEDQFLLGNLPSALSIQKGSIKTQLIRFGQPLINNSKMLWWCNSPILSPEFKVFLNLHSTHLYVNLMKRQGVEGPLSMGLETLENEFPHLYVITLDKNSSFYKQDEEMYPEVMESLSFQNIFLDHLLKKNGNYFWSNHIDKSTWKQELQQIILTIHESTFRGKETLNKTERQDFIELVYLMILDKLVERWHPASMNITCRQGMDRGPSLSTLWLLQNQQLSDREAAAFLLTPSLLIHNRPIHAPRIKRLISAARQKSE